MANFKFKQIKTLQQLIKNLNFMFQNLNSQNVKNLDFRETEIIDSMEKTKIFDDFLYQTLTEIDTYWILNHGSDPTAQDPTVNLQQSGVIRCVSGDADGTVAADGSQIVMSIPVVAEQGDLIFETILKILSDVTQISVNAGFTDSTSLEEPFSNASDIITSICTDGACFVYDDGATTKEWFSCAVNNNTDDTRNGATGNSPTADTWQTLRIEVSENGENIKFYIDKELVKTLNGGGISPDIDLYATIVVCSTTTVSKSIDIDYIYISYNR